MKSLIGMLGITAYKIPEIDGARMEPKTETDARNVWSRMFALAENMPILEAVKEMARLLVEDGWANAPDSPPKDKPI